MVILKESPKNITKIASGDVNRSARIANSAVDTMDIIQELQREMAQIRRDRDSDKIQYQAALVSQNKMLENLQDAARRSQSRFNGCEQPR